METSLKKGDEVFGLAYGGRLFNADDRENLISDKISATQVPMQSISRLI